MSLDRKGDEGQSSITCRVTSVSTSLSKLNSGTPEYFFFYTVQPPDLNTETFSSVDGRRWEECVVLFCVRKRKREAELRFHSTINTSVWRNSFRCFHCCQWGENELRKERERALCTVLLRPRSRINGAQFSPLTYLHLC